MKSTLINTDDDRKFLATWQKLISNFVKYADPTPVVTDDIPKWKMAQDSRAASIYMDINLEPVERHEMFAERMEFWNRMYFQDLLKKYTVAGNTATSVTSTLFLSKLFVIYLIINILD